MATQKVVDGASRYGRARSTVSALLIAALLPLLLTSCAKLGSPANGTTPTTSRVIPTGVILTGPVNNYGAVTPASNVIVVDMYDNFFVPTFLMIKVGALAALIVHNRGSVAHTFTSSTLGVDRTLEPGESFQQWITPVRPGTYEFVCVFHAANGMRGAAYAQ